MGLSLGRVQTILKLNYTQLIYKSGVLDGQRKPCLIANKYKVGRALLKSNKKGPDLTKVN